MDGFLYYRNCISIQDFVSAHQQSCQIYQNEQDYKIFLYAASNVLEELFHKDYPAEIFQSSTQQLFGIIQVRGSDYRNTIEKYLREAQVYMKKLFSFSFSASYSETAEHPMMLNDLYSETLKLMQYKYLLGSEAIISRKDCLTNLNNVETTYPQDLENRLIQALKSGDPETADSALVQIFSRIKELKYGYVMPSTITLVNHINFFFKEIGHYKNILDKIHINDIYQKAAEVEYLDDFSDYLRNYVAQALSAIAAKNDYDNSPSFIQTTTAHIMSNYSDNNLTPQSIADMLGLSSKYVMRKFKEHTNLSLNEYILKVRMEHAAKLLSEDTLPIREIVEKIGLDSENYFYRLFKKTYGCTPREFTQHAKRGD